MNDDELKKSSPVEAENTLLPWVDYLTVCKAHKRPVVGHQLGFMWVPGPFPTDPQALVPTRKGMCRWCLNGDDGPPADLPETPDS